MLIKFVTITFDAEIAILLLLQHFRFTNELFGAKIRQVHQM